MNGLQTYPGKKIRYLWSDTQKSVIMELLAACEKRDAGSINFCFTPYAASHTFAQLVLSYRGVRFKSPPPWSQFWLLTMRAFLTNTP